MTRKKSPLKRLFMLFLLCIVLWQAWWVGWLLWWKWQPPQSTAFMQRYDSQRYQWVPYHKIALPLKQAVIAAEDAHFMEHHGFDWEGLSQAWEHNMNASKKKGKVRLHGGSTLTQQLAKNLFLSSSRSYWRKANEAILTLWLEGLWDKRRILEVYLNVVELGVDRRKNLPADGKTALAWQDTPIYGAEAASLHYFGVSALKLTPSQAARLAALLPAPRRYGLSPYSPYINDRTEQILSYLAGTEVP